MFFFSHEGAAECQNIVFTKAYFYNLPCNIMFKIIFLINVVFIRLSFLYVKSKIFLKSILIT